IPRWSLVRLIICHSELGEIKQAQDVMAKVKAHYPGLRLDEIVDQELDFYEDPTVCIRYRAILQRVEKEE
ncbi:adenylate cyclase, partial [Rhizobiaceae sp. 2RAB30]